LKCNMYMKTTAWGEERLPAISQRLVSKAHFTLLSVSTAAEHPLKLCSQYSAAFSFWNARLLFPAHCAGKRRLAASSLAACYVLV